MRFDLSCVVVTSMLGISSAGAQTGLLTASRDTGTAFVDVTVIPMDRERMLSHQTVLVNGDRITALGPVRQVHVPAGARRVDGRDKFLLPGLADMHVHLEGASAEAAGPRLWLFLANGVTTVRDMHSTRTGGAQSLALVLRRQVAQGERVGPRIYTAGDPDLSDPAAAAQSVTALRALAPDFIKLGHDALDASVYDSVRAATRRAGFRLVGHVPTAVGLERVLQDRWASIEHLTGYHDYLLGTKNVANQFLFNPELQGLVDTARWMRPGYRLEAAALRHIAMVTRQAGVWNCPTLFVYAQAVPVFVALGTPGTIADTAVASHVRRAVVPVARRLAEFNLQLTKALHDGGAGLLLGTDVSLVGGGAPPMPPPGFSIHGELALLVAAGLTPYQALATGTRNVAEFMGTLDTTGTVAVGKRADLVLLAGNPLVDLGYLAGPAGTMVGGRWLPRAELETQLAALADTSIQQARQHLWQH